MVTTTQLTAAALLGATLAYAALGLRGPENFEDCILHTMRGVSSDSAARQIRAACRAKFPNPALLDFSGSASSVPPP
jgi:hypothetical protein